MITVEEFNGQCVWMLAIFQEMEKSWSEIMNVSYIKFNIWDHLYFKSPISITILQFWTNHLLTDVQEWYREPEQTIESALTENTFCDFPLEYEILGESLAIKSDSTGFYTTSDWQENAPIYSYHFKC